MRVPYIIYVDFEALNIPVDNIISNSTHTYKQIPCSYCYIVIRSDGIINEPVLYRGENAVEHFLKDMQTELDSICRVLSIQ